MMEAYSLPAEAVLSASAGKAGDVVSTKGPVSRGGGTG